MTERKQKPTLGNILISWDTSAMWQGPMKLASDRGADTLTLKKTLEDIIDEHARAQIDQLAHCIWISHETLTPGFKTATYHTTGNYLWYQKYVPGFKKFHEDGYDFVQVMLDRCRKNGLDFLIGLRMNDRHEPAVRTRFYKEHPEWRLEEYLGGMDYKYEGVREPILAFIKEALERYDVDGVELDWMRWCHMFRPCEAVENTSLLTEFTAKARKLLDVAAAKRGRGRLLLGVRIPQTMEECWRLGFDVAAWVKQGLVDYICPSDFFYTDFGMRVEDFAKLTKGTNCKVYPSVHPLISRTYDCITDRLLDGANYRAAARNHYAYGADGISVYNFQYHWARMYGSHVGQPEMWPKALSYLTALRDPKLLEEQDRHYLYYPLSGGLCTTGAVKNERIILNRGNPSPVGGLPGGFRMAEDLSDSALSAVLEFKVMGLAEGDELKVEINGTWFGEDQLKRSYFADPRSTYEDRPLPPYHLYRLDLTSPPARFGDNWFAVRLTKSAGRQTPIIQDLEVIVRVKR